MKRVLAVVVAVGLVGCSDDTNIQPDPTSSETSATGAGGEGTGGDGQGGAPSSSSTGTPGGGFEAGSRLKVRAIVADDGARQPVGWFDSELGVECSFRPDAVGSTRCLPLAHNATYFADSGCNTPLVLLSCSATFAHAAVSPGGCGPGQRIHTLGPSTTPPADVYIRTGGNCVFGGQAPTGAWYSVGPELPTSTFVQAATQTEP